MVSPDSAGPATGEHVNLASRLMIARATTSGNSTRPTTIAPASSWEGKGGYKIIPTPPLHWPGCSGGGPRTFQGSGSGVSLKVRR